ncbi:MAG: HAMP domain-containing protein [Gammaproteobacteria bacterium]|nr:HAMP domain-containing protein [Gammaproteobacteria bacterium]
MNVMSSAKVGLFAKLPIRHKIWAGFALLLILLMVVGVITQISLMGNETRVVKLVNDVQPTVVASLNLVDQMDRASAALGFYLLSKESIHKKDYLDSLKHINESVRELKKNDLIVTEPEMVELIKRIEESIGKLTSYKELMLKLATDDAENIPAMRFAAAEVNPRVQTMMQSLQEILLYEEDQAASPERKKFAMQVGNLRYKLQSAVNELRLYLAFRAEAQAGNFISFRDLAAADADKLYSYDDNFLSFEQIESVNNFKKTFSDYFKAADKLFKIHRAADWRKDAYLIRTEIAPLTLKIQEELNRLVEKQYKISKDDSTALKKLVRDTQAVVIGLMLAGLIAATIVGTLLSRAITRPIESLKISAAALASGKLDQEIDTARQDELGSLAKSFANMRDAIRKKIHDLHILNNTGNNLAGLHNQIVALQTALKVMGEKTNVQWGSVYLINEKTKLLEIMAYFPEREADEHKAKSFTFGEGILGEAAVQRRVIYIPDTSKEPRFVTGLKGVNESKAIVCVPMFDGDEVFGVMNFCGEIGKVKFEDSDAEFAETIARMTVVTTKNIKMLNVIEEQNHTLEHKVEERTAELKQKTNDINNMLQNMHQGIFTIDISQQIHHEYSAYLETILMTKQIDGKHLMEVLFDNSDLGSNARDQVKAALSAVLGEDLMMYDFNKHCLVNEYVRKMPDGGSKILELDWDPIVFENDIIDKMMVTVRDVTELRGLQVEAEQQKWELEVIGQILKVSQQKFEGFLSNAYDFIAQNQQAILNTDQINQDVIGLLFRNMHTIKGNARTYGFDFITDTVHEVENTYDKLRKHQLTQWNKEQLLLELDQAKQLIDIYDRIYHDKLSTNQSDGVYVDSDLFEKAKETINRVNFNDKRSLTDGVMRIRTLVRAVGTETLGSLLESIHKSIPELAQRLGKDTPKLVVEDDGVRFASDVAPVLKNVLTHAFRNAIDHGIETTEQRQALGKPISGTITLRSQQEGDNLFLTLSDDGQGLDLARIRDKAIEQGLISVDQHLSAEQISNLIFLSGLSTAENVTQVSGRGVGMDAIKKFLNQIGGDVVIKLIDHVTATEQHRRFELVMSLPATSYVKVA